MIRFINHIKHKRHSLPLPKLFFVDQTIFPTSKIPKPCISKRIQYRSFSSKIESQLFSQALIDTDSYTKIPGRTIIQVEGADSLELLQGLTTNNMPLIGQGGPGFLQCFLYGNGRVLADAFIYPKNFGSTFPHQIYFIEIHAELGQTLMNLLRLHKLRSDVSIKDVSSEYSVWSIWGPSERALIGKPSNPFTRLPRGSLVYKNCEYSGAQIWINDNRALGMGVRIIIPSKEVRKFRFTLLAISSACLPNGFTRVTPDEYKLRRILKGVPEGPSDFVNKVSFPLELNLDYMNGGINLVSHPAK
ncbi:hypothetical protein BB558_000463 [Smittium angustum]|uniref:Uncharacterized protein n=1 Tax=Smittium angustum TaxID=133377 RepID=A0A2U1JE13_SMIAN|nr:hypothetical protein BB558_000463 [Smittium angustum]